MGRLRTHNSRSCVLPCLGLTQGPESLASAVVPERAQGRGHLAGLASRFLHPQVALDVVEELCAEMALTRPEAFDEYVIFVVTNRGEQPEDEAVWAHNPHPDCEAPIRCCFLQEAPRPVRGASACSTPSPASPYRHPTSICVSSSGLSGLEMAEDRTPPCLHLPPRVLSRPCPLGGQDLIGCGSYNPHVQILFHASFCPHSGRESPTLGLTWPFSMRPNLFPLQPTCSKPATSQSVPPNSSWLSGCSALNHTSSALPESSTTQGGEGSNKIILLREFTKQR